MFVAEIMNKPIIQKIISKTYYSASVIKKLDIERGIISNKVYENVSCINDFIKEDIINEIKISQYKPQIKSHDNKTHKNLVSIIVNAICKLNESIETPQIIDEVKTHIIKQINGQKYSVNESFNKLNFTQSKTLFDVYLARKIFESKKTIISLDEIECPTGIKLLLKETFDTHLRYYNGWNIQQLNENIDTSMIKLLDGMTKDDILDKMKEMIIICSDYWNELSFSVTNILPKSKTVTFEDILNIAYVGLTVPIYNNDNLLLNYLVDTQENSNKMLKEMVLNHKDDFIGMIRFLFSHFQSFIKKFNLKDKINVNGIWRRDKKIQQGFVSIIGEIMDARVKTLSTGKIDYQSHFWANLNNVIKTLSYQIYLEGDLDVLIESCEFLTDLSDKQLQDGFNKLTETNKKWWVRFTESNCTFDEVKTLVMRIELYLLPYLKSNEFKQSNQIEIAKESYQDDKYTQTYYIIDYEIAKKVAHNIPLDDEIPIYLKWIEEHKGEIFIPEDLKEKWKNHKIK